MDGFEINAHLKRKRLTRKRLGELALQRTGKTASGGLISDVIYGVKKSARVANLISQELKIPVSRLWPGLYEKRGR
jgi:hypothetical protein